MLLSISATLTEEEILILATAKWRSNKKNINKNDNWVITIIEVNNDISASEFIVNVYQSMIVQDATRIFTEYRTQELKEQITQTENVVTEQVTQAITSSIE